MSPERPRGEPPKEDERPYYRAVRFPGEKAARRAYFATQETIFATDWNMSTYRLILGGIWHVAVMGDQPPEELERKLMRALRHGDPVQLPYDVLRPLQQRGETERRNGLWTERHYRLPEP